MCQRRMCGLQGFSGTTCVACGVIGSELLTWRSFYTGSFPGHDVGRDRGEEDGDRDPGREGGVRA
jgi:hypothetical protein